MKSSIVRRHRNKPRVFSLPATRTGWWAVILTGAFLALMALFFMLVESGQRGGDTFFSNLWLAGSIGLAAVAGVAGGVVALFAIFARRERSLLAFLAVFIAAFIIFWVTAELTNHAEPVESTLVNDVYAQIHRDAARVGGMAAGSWSG